MEKNKFFKACDEQFSLLEGYRFQPRTKKVEAGTFIRVFQNDTTAVEVAFEYPEQYLYVRLCRLIDGIIVDNPTIVRQDSKLYCFNLENLLLLRAPKVILGPNRHHELTFSQVEDALKTYANAVMTYASDVLQGDFKVFSQLNDIVKKRAARSESQERTGGRTVTPRLVAQPARLQHVSVNESGE